MQYTSAVARLTSDEEEVLEHGCHPASGVVEEVSKEFVVDFLLSCHLEIDSHVSHNATRIMIALEKMRQ